MSNINFSSLELLLKRFDDNIRQIYSQLSILEISLNNLKGSWVAINQTYKAHKREISEEV